MTARKRKSTRPVVLSPIITTRAQADDLARIYARMLEPWSRAAEMLSDAYGRELARLTDGLTTDIPSDIGATVDAIAAAVNRLVLELTPDLRRWAFRTEEWHRGKWARAVLAGVDVAIDTLLGPEDVRETIDAFLVRNTSLIRDINSQARGRIADAVLRGYQQRSPIAEVAKEIREAAGLATKRARRVAADQSVKLASALDRERQRQAGLDIFKYRHSHKLHPRETHKARDGGLYELDTGREVKFVNGEKVYGSDTIAPDDMPGIPPFCACTTQAVLVFEGEVL